MRQQPMLVTALITFIALITVLRPSPMVDREDIDGTMMTWIATDGVRVCALRSSIPWDVSPETTMVFGQGQFREGPDFTGNLRADQYRYNGKIWVCPIDAID